MPDLLYLSSASPKGPGSSTAQIYFLHDLLSEILGATALEKGYPQKLSMLIIRPIMLWLQAS